MLIKLLGFATRGMLRALSITVLSAMPIGYAFANPYVVADINVDLTRETSAIARQDGLEQAHVSAFKHLLQRLTPASAHDRLPLVDYATAADHASGLKIEDEQTTATRYAAKMAISFRQDLVRSYLKENGLAFAETAAPSVVVAPLYLWAGAQSLWEPNNPWAGAWKFRGPSDGLAPVMLPLGDLADRGALSPEQALSRDRSRLSAFAARYGAAGVLVAEARYGVDAVSGRPRLDAIAEVVGDGPNIGRFRHTELGSNGDKPETLGVRAANAIVAALEGSWKRQSSAPDAGGLNSLIADLPVGGVLDYADARRRLDASPGVSRHELVMLSRDIVRLRLFYSGSQDDLRAGLARQSMDLAPNTVGSEAEWVLIAPPRVSRR
jgi:hypothetical protein